MIIEIVTRTATYVFHIVHTIAFKYSYVYLYTTLYRAMAFNTQLQLKTSLPVKHIMQPSDTYIIEIHLDFRPADR